MFYYFAVVQNYSIHDALNIASQYYIGWSFDSINNLLYQGYSNPYSGKLQIWGDPAITLP
jgi:hypothetical protein